MTVTVARFVDLERWDPLTLTAAVRYAFPVAVLGDLADVRLGSQVPRKGSKPAGATRPYLRSANIRRGFVDTSDVREMTISEGQANALLLQTGDVLFVEGSGSIREVGRAAAWDGAVDGCIHQNSVVRARLRDDELDPEFVVTWFNSRAGNAYVREQATTTSGLFHIGAAKLAGAPVPMADRVTQIRVVDEVRQERRHAVDARARAERLRAEAWEQFSEAAASATPMTAGERSSITVQRFADLDRWDTVSAAVGVRSHHEVRTLGDVAEVRLGVQIPAKSSPAGPLVRYLRAANVQSGFLSLDDVKSMTASDAVVARLRLAADDVLVVEGNSFEEVGRAAVWPGASEEFIIQNSVIRVRLHTDELRPDFVAAWLNCRAGRAYARAVATTTSGSLWHLGAGKLLDAPIPVPSHELQAELVLDLMRGLAHAGEANADVAVHLERAEAVVEDALLRPGM